MSRKVIITNKIKCNECEDVIESKTRHDFVSCSCGKVAVDGGRFYLKRSFTPPYDYTELSEYADIEEKN